jgi:hypothetical protein
LDVDRNSYYRGANSVLETQLLAARAENDSLRGENMRLGQLIEKMVEGSDERKRKSGEVDEEVEEGGCDDVSDLSFLGRSPQR